MSYTLTFIGTESTLIAKYHPPIDLRNDEYAIGLISVSTYNSIANIDETNNKFNYFLKQDYKPQPHVEINFLNDTKSDINQQYEVNTYSMSTTTADKLKTCFVPTGSYEIRDIEKKLRELIISTTPELKDHDEEKILSLKANNNTLTVDIKSEDIVIYFDNENSLAQLLGYFAPKVLEPGKLYQSIKTVEIARVHSVRVDCNIVTGSYNNDILTHTIYEFPISVPPGYAICEIPSNIIYLPVLFQRIDNITLSLLDQDNKPVNFRGEKIIIRLHLKKVT